MLPEASTNAKTFDSSTSFFAAATLADRKAAMDSLQQRFYEVMPYVVTGQFLAPKAWRDNVTGMVNASEFVFWNVEKK